MNPEHHDEIKRLLTDCTFDHIFDVRSEFYYENWRIRGGEHHPFTGNARTAAAHGAARDLWTSLVVAGATAPLQNLRTAVS